LLRPGEGGLKQTDIAHARRAAVESEKTAVEREGIALDNPDWFNHLTKEVGVCIATAKPVPQRLKP